MAIISPGTLESPVIQEELVRAIREGVPIGTALTAVGVPESTWYDWMQVARNGHYRSGTPARPEMRQQAAQLSHRLAHAAAEREAEAVQRIREAGGTTGRSGVIEWRAEAWYLNNSPFTRNRWREHRELTVDNQVQVSIVDRNARQMDDTTLLQALEGEFTALPGPETPELD